MDEKQALLFKGQKNSRRNYPRDVEESPEFSSEGSDEWWEDSHSSCSSCCDSCSRSSFEWEAEINENGQLFYIESDINSVSGEVNNFEYQKPEADYTEKLDKIENVKGGHLVNWIRRRDIKKLQLKQKVESNEIYQPGCQPQTQENAANKNSMENSKELKKISLKINSICEGSTLSEKLLGLTLDSLNTNEIAVTNINHDGPAQKCKDLLVGDILLGINNFNITPQNLDSILASLNLPTEVLLKIKKNVSNEKIKRTKYQSNFVKSLLEKNDALEALLSEYSIGIVVVDMESQNLNKDDVIYNYPDTCVLPSCRGAFVTLFHLLAEIKTNDECQSSSILMKKQLTHVLYKSENNLLLLIAIPAQKCTIREANYVVSDLIRNLLFSHQTLKRPKEKSLLGFRLKKLLSFKSFKINATSAHSNSMVRCFEKSDKSELDKIFSLFFSRILTNGFSSSASGFISLEKVSSFSTEAGLAEFEDILPHAVWVPLPKEAQIQIDDALNELEANELECEREEGNILENRRLFNIIGSCLFHKGYLLLSHLPKEDLLDVYSFYRQNCLIQLFRNEPVKSLIIWREVYPHSGNRGLSLNKPLVYSVRGRKWFLLVVGQGYHSLAVIFEAGGCCAATNENPGPAASYVDEAKQTLEHMQKLGIFSLSSQWIESNSRFKTITPEEVFERKVNKKKENLLGFVKSFDGNSKASGSSKSSDLNPKRTRGLQQDTSEDSVSQTASNVSEVSDENAPILGRRGERRKNFTEQASDSDSSNSDWDSSRDSNMRESTCSSNIDNFYLGDIEEVIPAKLTTGSDYLLFYYINMDGNEGILMNPPLNSKRSTPKMMEVIENFRKCAQIIHSVLENNIKFKRGTQDSSKNFINKSLTAVKEHGVLFECLAPESDSHKKPVAFTYWIVGRLFFTPQPREVYVCYYDDAPQNLVEIAFRLGLNAAG